MKRFGTFPAFVAALGCAGAFFLAAEAREAAAAGCAPQNCCFCDDGCHNVAGTTCSGVGENCTFHSKSQCLTSGNCSAITAGSLVSLNGAATGAGVTLVWEVAEGGSSLFYVLRADSADGPFVPDPAPVTGEAGQTAFSYTDAGASSGYYKVEEVREDGSAVVHGTIGVGK